jgi:hypothetical protein
LRCQLNEERVVDCGARGQGSGQRGLPQRSTCNRLDSEAGRQVEFLVSFLGGQDAHSNRHPYGVGQLGFPMARGTGFLDGSPELPHFFNKWRRAEQVVGDDVCIWLTRLRGDDSSSVKIWPSCSLNDCGLMLDAVEDAMYTLMNSLPPINTDYITFVRESAGQRWKP